MFDVSWGDSNRELVGEHRAKKELRNQQKEKDKEKGKKRGSSSTPRSSRSSAESALARWRPRGLKRLSAGDANGGSKSIDSEQVASPISPSNGSVRSPLSPTFDLTSRRSSDNAMTRTSLDPSSLEIRSECDSTSANRREVDQASPGSSRHDSVFSKYAESDAGSPSTFKSPGHQLPSLPMASPTIELQSVSFESRRTFSSEKGCVAEAIEATDISNGRPLTTECKPLRTVLQSQTCTQGDGSDPSSKLATSCPEQNFGSSQRYGPNNPKRQQPHEWSSDVRQKPTLNRESRNSCNDSALDQLPPLAFDTQSGVESWNQYMTCLANLTDDELLSEFTNLAFMEPCLASHEETDLKLRLMMLCSLDNLDPIFGATRLGRHATANPYRPGGSHLAFHETQDTVAYLAAASPKCEITHLSTSPLTNQFSPNIRPLSTRGTESQAWPADAESFDTVSCLKLPSICPQAEIPGILSNIASLLKPGGTLQLTLIDPLPLAGTLGPHMHNWLQQNLMNNLEKNQGCRNPRKAFPAWLAQTKLRSHGSSLTTTKFYAVPTCIVNSRHSLTEESAMPMDKSYHEKLVKAEIRSHVGRLLWAEVWGPFVTASQWWWEDPVCVEECIELQTIWNYYLIESRKE